MQPLLTTSGLQPACHDRQKFLGGPYRSGSWEPPVAVRARTRAPVRHREAMEHLAFKIISKGSGRPSCEKVSDLSIGVPLPGLHEGIEDASQNARPLCDRFTFRSEEHTS